MYNILKTLNIKIKMVSDTFHNVGVMIDPKRRKSSCRFPGADVRGGAEGVWGCEVYNFRPPPCIFMIFKKKLSSAVKYV